MIKRQDSFGRFLKAMTTLVALITPSQAPLWPDIRLADGDDQAFRAPPQSAARMLVAGAEVASKPLFDTRTPQQTVDDINTPMIVVDSSASLRMASKSGSWCT